VSGVTTITATLDYGIAGAFDGQTYAISDGVHQRTFEFDDNNQLNNPANIRVTFQPTDTAAQLAKDMIAAINGAASSQFQVHAATADANNNNTATLATPGDTSNRVNLFGAAWVQVGAPPVVISGPSTPGSASVPAPAHTTIASALDTGINSDTNAPQLASVTPAGAGSLAPNTTYYYKVTAIYANGETIGGNEISASTGANGALLLSWNAAATTGFNISSQTLTQVTGYNIYRGTAAGAENILAGHVAAGILSFNDTGAGVVAPAVNGTRLIPPVLNPIPPANVGGALAVNTYYYVVTAISPIGETIASGEQSQFTTAGDQTLNLSWTATTGAIGYKIYRGTSAGGENQLVGAVSGNATTTFVDDGAEITTPGAPPAIDSTALNSPSQNPITPALGGTLASGAYFYQITAVNAQGETTANAAQSGVANAANSQQTLDLSWSAAPGAIGYNIYRGTSAAGPKTLLTFVVGGATTSFNDAGAAST